MTVEGLFARLEIREARLRATFSTDSDSAAPYEFALCRKQAALGDVAIDQFWMAIPSLYGQRNRTAVNRHPLVEFWWALCGSHETRSEAAIQETHLLAKILPHARSNGSRRVFVDSFQTVPSGRSRRLRVWITELDRLLSDSCHEELDELAFQRTTGDLIGPPEYGAEVWDRYEVFRAELFEEAREALAEGGAEATEIVLRRWRRLMNSIGRRSGNELDKQVLDVLSYECRAALHRCYSAVWSVLLEALSGRFEMSDETYFFHQLWHFDRCRESDHGDQAYFHLFHGHVFGLHPACAPVLLTQTGGELFAEWLREGTIQSYQRVLHALAVAVGYYDTGGNKAGWRRPTYGEDFPVRGDPARVLHLDLTRPPNASISDSPSSAIRRVPRRSANRLRAQIRVANHFGDLRSCVMSLGHVHFRGSSLRHPVGSSCACKNLRDFNRAKSIAGSSGACRVVPDGLSLIVDFVPLGGSNAQ